MTKAEIRKKFRSKNTEVVFNDALYSTILSASALLLWDLKMNHQLTVEIFNKNGVGVIKKGNNWALVDWLPHDHGSEHGARGFRFAWSESKI